MQHLEALAVSFAHIPVMRTILAKQNASKLTQV